MKRILSIATPILVIAAGIGIFTLLHATKPEPEKRTEPPRGVTVFVEPVQRQHVDLAVQTQGEVRASTDVDIVSQVGGRVTSVSSEFTEGGIVEPGVALITIEDTDYQLALTQAEARVAGAEVAVQQALADADVARKQLANEPDPSPLALRIPQVAEARARLKAASADLELARLNLKRTKVSLPFRGRVSATLVDVGQYVVPGTPLGRAFATDTVEVRLPLTDTQLASLELPIGYVAPEEGGPTVDLYAIVAGAEQHWRGRLVRLDASIDSATRMLYGIAQVTDPYARGASQNGMPLAVGLYVNARIAGNAMEGAQVIPRDGLRAGNRVYVVNDAGRLEVRHVDVTHSDEREAVIARGLAEGERVVISSIRNPIEGMALEALTQPGASRESAVSRHDLPGNEDHVKGVSGAGVGDEITEAAGPATSNTAEG